CAAARAVRPDAGRLRHRVPRRRARAADDDARRDRRLARPVLLRARGDRPRLARRRRRLAHSLRARAAAAAPEDLAGPARHLLPGDRPQPGLAGPAPAAARPRAGPPRRVGAAHAGTDPVGARAAGLVRRLPGGPAGTGGGAAGHALADGVAAHQAGTAAGHLIRLVGGPRPSACALGRARRVPFDPACPGDEGPGRSPLPTGNPRAGPGRSGDTPPSCAFYARTPGPDPML